MLIIPAIDLQNGRCVRLRQGKFEDATFYGDPLAQLQAFVEAGASWVHVVDLDGARAKAVRQFDLIARLAKVGAVKLQVGGGVRSRDDVARLLDAGIGRVVIGSMAARYPETVQSWIDAFGPDRICCAFDVRSIGAEDTFEVAVDGWTWGEGLMLADALSFYRRYAMKHILVTDIARDGVLSGPNTKLIADLVALRPDLKVQGSGGVASLADLAALRAVGASAAIVGRALYENCFSLEAALAG